MNSKGYARAGHTMAAFALVLLVWKVLSLHFSPMVVPTIESVWHCIGMILTDAASLRMIGITCIRLCVGLSIGISMGLVLGIAMGVCRHIYGIAMPLIGLLQTVPPVSWVVLALVWFGFNGKPAVFIVVTATLPVIAINVSEGIHNVDQKLLEMASLYRLPFWKKLIHIVLPSIFPYFSSSLKVALGGGFKIAVMGEVLTTSDGIGGMIKLARLNLEPESIIAWSFVIVALYLLFQLACSLAAHIWKGGAAC